MPATRTYTVVAAAIGLLAAFGPTAQVSAAPAGLTARDVPVADMTESLIILPRAEDEVAPVVAAAAKPSPSKSSAPAKKSSTTAKVTVKKTSTTAKVTVKKTSTKIVAKTTSKVPPKNPAATSKHTSTPAKTTAKAPPKNPAATSKHTSAAAKTTTTAKNGGKNNNVSQSTHKPISSTSSRKPTTSAHKTTTSVRKPTTTSAKKATTSSAGGRNQHLLSQTTHASLTTTSAKPITSKKPATTTTKVVHSSVTTTATPSPIVPIEVLTTLLLSDLPSLTILPDPIETALASDLSIITTIVDGVATETVIGDDIVAEATGTIDAVLSQITAAPTALGDLGDEVHDVESLLGLSAGLGVTVTSVLGVGLF